MPVFLALSEKAHKMLCKKLGLASPDLGICTGACSDAFSAPGSHCGTPKLDWFTLLMFPRIGKDEQLGHY